MHVYLAHHQLLKERPSGLHHQSVEKPNLHLIHRVVLQLLQQSRLQLRHRFIVLILSLVGFSHCFSRHLHLQYSFHLFPLYFLLNTQTIKVQVLLLCIRTVFSRCISPFQLINSTMILAPYNKEEKSKNRLQDIYFSLVDGYYFIYLFRNHMNWLTHNNFSSFH